MTNRSGSGDDLDAITRALEQLRDQLAGQRDLQDPALLANRIHDDLTEIQERLRQFGDTFSAQLATSPLDPDAGG